MTQGKSRTTERCTTFPVFQESTGALKDQSWQQIEPRALEMERLQLHRCVQGQDLFAKEAKFHKSCLQSFKLDYLAHCRKITKNDDKASASVPDPVKVAHEKAFQVTVQF